MILEPIGKTIWPPDGNLGFSFPLNISSSVWAMDMKFCTLIDIYWKKITYHFGTIWKSNMAARRPSWIFVFAQYLKKYLSNWFKILHIYRYILDKGLLWFWSRSGNQCGRQAAILDFRFCSISQETFEQFIWNFAYLLVCIRQRSTSILDPIRYPIWLPGGHLGFSFPLNISRSFWAIDLIICEFIGTC